MSELFLSEKNNQGVVTITINRPEIHNAFNDEMIEKMTHHFDELNKDDSIRLVVLTGAGKSFCAGADLNWMKKMKDYTPAENYEDSLALSGLFQSINRFKAPVIGKVNGAALGGGAGLVSVCDFVIASETAKFGFSEVRLGLVPAVISPFVMAKIGESHARAWFLSGERFDARLAKEMGLVHKVAAANDFESECQSSIEQFLLAAPGAQRSAKELVRNVLHLSLQGKEKVTDHTCKTISQIRIGKEGQEGMAALLEKRKPSWLKK